MLYFVGFFVSFSKLAFLFLAEILTCKCIHIYLTLLGIWGLLFFPRAAELSDSLLFIPSGMLLSIYGGGCIVEQGGGNRGVKRVGVIEG